MRSHDLFFSATKVWTIMRSGECNVVASLEGSTPMLAQHHIAVIAPENINLPPCHKFQWDSHMYAHHIVFIIWYLSAIYMNCHQLKVLYSDPPFKIESLYNKLLYNRLPVVKQVSLYNIHFTIDS